MTNEIVATHIVSVRKGNNGVPDVRDEGVYTDEEQINQVNEQLMVELVRNDDLDWFELLPFSVEAPDQDGQLDSAMDEIARLEERLAFMDANSEHWHKVFVQELNTNSVLEGKLKDLKEDLRQEQASRKLWKLSSESWQRRIIELQEKLDDKKRDFVLAEQGIAEIEAERQIMQDSFLKEVKELRDKIDEQERQLHNAWECNRILREESEPTAPNVIPVETDAQLDAIFGIDPDPTFEYHHCKTACDEGKVYYRDPNTNEMVPRQCLFCLELAVAEKRPSLSQAGVLAHLTRGELQALLDYNRHT